MIHFGNHYRASVDASEREPLRRFYIDVLECELQSSDNITANIPENIDLFIFGCGNCFGIEYFDAGSRTLTREENYLACWMEIKTDDVTKLKQKCLDFGAIEITDFWDSEHFYFHAPGGQVYRLIGVDEG